MKKEYLTRAEFGERIFQAIKAEITSRGFSLWAPNFDPNYPVSLRAIANIRKGKFEIKTLQKLPGIQVEEWFCLSVLG
jgi:hypothetical protein